MHRDAFRRIAFALALGGPALWTQPGFSQAAQGDDSLPVLYGVKLDGSRVAIDVVSTGCTDASNFSVQLDPASPDSHRLSVVARRPDRCRMGPHIVTVTLDLPAVANPAGAKFLLANRLAAPTTLRRSDR